VEFLLRYPQSAAHWHAHSNRLIFLSVADVSALQTLHERLLDAGLCCAAFHEPDIGDALTAIAVEPSPLVRKYCGGLPLCLKEYPCLAPSPKLITSYHQKT
jgi:hypothetical protein